MTVDPPAEPSGDLAGVALVTGSSSGIGAAVARVLAAAGMTVVVNSRSSREAGEALAASLPGASYAQADVADGPAVAGLVEHVRERHGRLDLLVNNAGTTEHIPYHDLTAATPEIWRRILDVNVVGTWQLTVAAVPLLRASGAGHVVNMSSLAGSRYQGASSVPYAVSKAAVDHQTRILAGVLGPAIRVNAVAPGLVETPWTTPHPERFEPARRAAPLQRVGQPEDVAAAVVGLHRMRHVTGEVLLVDGGTHVRI